ncbi:MAG: cobalamin-binding protein [Casimicrobiaceae bacterium]
MKLSTWVRPLALLAWLLPGGACAAGVAATDDVGARVSLPAPARRIVSLAPSATEIVYAAGAGAALVGVVSSSDFPPAARSVTRVGDAHGLDLERIVALAPDLIVTWPYTVPAQLARLRERGIAIFMVDPRDVDGIAGAVAQVGVLAGTRPVADAAARDLRARYAGLTAHYRDRPSIAVFYEVWGAPVVTLGGTHLVTRALEACGGRNVFADADGPAPNVGVEAVLVARPEVIIAGVAGAVRPAWLDDWRRWPMLPAVAYGNLLAVNADWLHRPGPRFVDGVAELCRTLDEARRRRGQHGAGQP